MTEAIIFDLDGTLWDSSDSVCAIWNRVFDRHPEAGVRMTQELLGTLMGKTMDEIGDILFPALSAEARQIIVNELSTEENAYLAEHGAVLYPDLEETLEQLSRQYGLYIVSNCQDGYVQAFLQAHKLGRYFQDVEMSGRTGMVKGPNIRLLMERNGIQKAIYVGDTTGDEQASRLAGIPFVWASYGFGRADAPDAVIDSLPVLPQTAAALLRKPVSST